MAHLQRHNKKKVDDVVEVGADGSLAPPPESGRRRRAREMMGRDDIFGMF